MVKTLLPAQCRAARAFLDITQPELATAAGISSRSLRDFEAGKRLPHESTIAAILQVLTARGCRMVYERDGSIGLIVDPVSET